VGTNVRLAIGGSACARLPRSFFERDTVAVARDLLGCVLAHETRAGIAAGRIVETEAYLAQSDAASHAYRGPTRRNASMFERAGTAYVYFIYGAHYCFNVVTGPKHIGEAVLVRALEPLAGLAQMRARRGVSRDRDLCSGPGKLAQALAIGREHDGVDLCRGPLGIYSMRAKDGVSQVAAEHDIVVGPRIGITRDADRPLRFHLLGNAHVSRR
jgi:DNA-3-methyladenine glycosylase